MIVGSPHIDTRLQAEDGGIIIPKKVEIGGWNMDLDASKDVTFTIEGNFTDILGFTGIIYNDLQTLAFGIPYVRVVVATLYIDAFFNQFSDGIVSIARTGGGYFDDLAFNDDGINRGHIYCWYKI